MKKLPIHEPGTTITHGFRGRYPTSFFKHLEKILGIKFVYLKPKTTNKKIEVQPLSPPSGKLYYIEPKYK